jgi:glycosyltransferase involved in cell wall biosynthesis
VSTPHVLHVVADWGIPSERFVVDLVTSAELTRPSVVCGRRHPVLVRREVPVTALMPVAVRVPYRFRKQLIRVLATGAAVRRRTDLLHAHFGYWAGHAASVARRLRLPWVLSLHGHDLLVRAATDPELTRLRTAERVIVPSRFLAEHARDLGYPTERIRVIPSGIDIDSYPFRPRTAPPNGPIRVTFAGRFVPKKGALESAQAMAAAQARGLSLACRFVGYGPLEEALRAELRRLRLDAAIVDGRPPDAVRRALAETDLLVTASQTAPDGDAESLGLVNVEAQACGVPVISTRHGGIPDAVAPEAGVLVPERDAEALAAALVTVASAPARWAAMGAAGRAHVEQRFRLADRVRDIETEYAQVLDARAGQRPRNRP